MTGFINYMIEANICLIVLLGGYKMLFSSETSFRSQRFFLLAAIVISLSAPLININYSQRSAALSMNQVMPSSWLQEITVSGQEDANNVDVTSKAWTVAGVIYFTVVVSLLLALLLQSRSLLLTISTTNFYRLGNYKITESGEDKPTFSFFNFIYIGNACKLTVAEKQQIIAHESVHAKQFHSLDILLISMVGIFFWFNPFIRTYKKLLIHLHEFEADAKTVEQADANKYCNLLAKVALYSGNFSLANHFNYSLTSKRIEMIRTLKKKTQQWKFAAMIIIFTLCFAVLSSADQSLHAQSAEALTYVEQPAVPEGGMETFYNNLKRQIRYPASSRRNKIQGKVLAEFIITQEGLLSNIKILESPDPVLADEVTRVLKTGPKWIPGKQSGKSVNQRMILPLKFKLADIQSNIVESKNPEGSLNEIIVIGYPSIK